MERLNVLEGPWHGECYRLVVLFPAKLTVVDEGTKGDLLLTPAAPVLIALTAPRGRQGKTLTSLAGSWGRALDPFITSLVMPSIWAALMSPVCQPQRRKCPHLSCGLWAPQPLQSVCLLQPGFFVDLSTLAMCTPGLRLSPCGLPRTGGAAPRAQLGTW